ncbi:MAG: hypothetical protein ACI8ZF_000176 [Candidatus Midichloriaceae bacterium]|jgi:hypothetical protein
MINKNTKDQKEYFIEHELIVKGLKRLNDIINKEIIFLKNNQYEEATKILDEKMELITFFQKHDKEIFEKYLKNNDDEDGNNDKKKEEIKNLVQNLLGNSETGMREIKKAKFISNKVFETLKEITNKRKDMSANYQKNGNKSIKGVEDKFITLSKEV